jgi:hypothetical protein
LISLVRATGKKSDVLLTNGSDQLLVETTILHMSVPEHKTFSLSRRLSWQLMNLEWQYKVRISCSFNSASLEDETIMAQWFYDIEEAAIASMSLHMNRWMRVVCECNVKVPVHCLQNIENC